MIKDSRRLPTIVHKTKNSILAIERLSKILLGKETLSGDYKRKVELIHRTAKDASGHFKEIDFSSSPVLADDLTFEPVNVGAVLEQVVECSQPHAEYKNQEIRCEDLDENAVVMGDEMRLRTAMKNLVNNALKYSPPGEIIEVWVTRSGDEVRFSVSDSGPGLKLENLEQLLKPFQRNGQQPTDEEVSLGLGLFLVKEVVGHHNGEINVKTAKGEGSTFTIILPAASMPITSLFLLKKLSG